MPPSLLLTQNYNLTSPHFNSFPAVSQQQNFFERKLTQPAQKKRKPTTPKTHGQCSPKHETTPESKKVKLSNLGALENPDPRIFPLSPSVTLLTPHVTTTPKLPKIVKKSAKNTKIAQKITKNVRFLRKNTKKYQFSTIFLPQNAPRLVKLRNYSPHLRTSKFSPSASSCALFPSSNPISSSLK